MSKNFLLVVSRWRIWSKNICSWHRSPSSRLTHSIVVCGFLLCLSWISLPSKLPSLWIWCILKDSQSVLQKLTRRMSSGDMGVHAHRTTSNSYHYNFPCVYGHIFPAVWWDVIRSKRWPPIPFSPCFRCFMTIEDDYLLLLKIREWGCTILLFMFGVMLWVRDGVATIPTTLIIRSSDTKYVDQCVTLTPSSSVLRSKHLLLVVSRRSTWN